MRARSSVFIATSLDGFIARLDGSIDWLNAANSTITDGEDCGYGAFMATIDTLVMGRHTFEQVVTFDPWPYEFKKVVVLSSRSMLLPKRLEGMVSTSSEAPRALVARLTAEGCSHIYVDGGKTIQSFLAEDLIDEITITTVPILLGAGRPLFGRIPSDKNLKLVSSMAYPFGFVQTTYSVSSEAVKGGS